MLEAFRRRNQDQLDSRAIEISSATMERMAAHEKTCGDRWEENRKCLEEMQKSIAKRMVLTQALHDENKAALDKIKNTIRIGIAVGTAIGFLATPAGHNVTLFLSSLGK